MVTLRLASLGSLAWIGSCAAPRAADWRDTLDERLANLGHRNVIAIVDAAYPEQAKASVRTVATHAEQLSVLREVLERVQREPHVRARVALDRELEYVPEGDAPGIEQHRAALRAALLGVPVEFLPHEELIARIDKTAQGFTVLVLKTDLALPYTSVFVTLECGYWSDDAETRLRETMAHEARQGILR
ncbi:MAG: hypothetical protein IT454_18130 [Planctomycetes bacterium]|nr:hypothetical protein [Planctomycetota bacterium]